MAIQKILSTLRRAVADYNMIEDGDDIIVGLSGGKDSLILLKALAAYRRFSPEKFNLRAVTVDLGFGADFSKLIEYCKSLDVEYHIEPSEIGPVIFDIRKEKNPCSLCSKMRRGALNSCVKRMGANKLALGHHADDLVETFFLSLIYEGRLSTFAPLSYMDRSDVTMIRPLLYCYEKDIAAEAKDLPILFNPCPANHHTQREYMKDLIKKINTDIPISKERIFSAITSPERYNLFDKYKNKDSKES